MPYMRGTDNVTAASILSQMDRQVLVVLCLDVTVSSLQGRPDEHVHFQDGLCEAHRQ